jgi:acetyl esterase
MNPTTGVVTILLSTLFFVSSGLAQASDKETFTYKKVGDRELKIHVTKPAYWKQTDSRPAVLFFHGGGWTGGKPGQFDQHCQHLASRGMVCFQVQYRLLSKNKADTTDRTPTNCIRDAKSAMRWVRRKASEFGVDANRIASGGGSAGGHLAAFLGTTDGTDDPTDDLELSARSNAMLLFNPVYDNGPGGWGAARVGDRFQEFSPAHNISVDDAPSIVFLGTSDNLIPVATAQGFQNQMEKQNVRSVLRLYAGARHGFFNAKTDGGKWFQLTLAETDGFLVSLGWLKKAQ